MLKKQHKQRSIKIRFNYKKNIKKWRLKELLYLIDEFENVISEAINKKSIKTENYETILANICGKTLVTSREIIALCANGYPDGALSLARNIFEQLIVIIFFEEKKNESDFIQIVERYFQNYSIQRSRILKDISMLRKDDKGETKFKNELEELKEKNSIKRISDYWWSGYNSFSELCKNVIRIESEKNNSAHDLLCNLYLLYKRACLSIHANCMGNAIRLGTNSCIDIVNTSQTTDGHEYPLYAVTSMLFFIIHISCDNFGVKYLLNTKLRDLSLFYSKFIKEF